MLIYASSHCDKWLRPACSMLQYKYTNILNRQRCKAYLQKFICRQTLLLFCSLLSRFPLLLKFIHSTTYGLGLCLPSTPDFHSPATNKKMVFESEQHIFPLHLISSLLPLFFFSLFSI